MIPLNVNGGQLAKCNRFEALKGNRLQFWLNLQGLYEVGVAEQTVESRSG